MGAGMTDHTNLIARLRSMLKDVTDEAADALKTLQAKIEEHTALCVKRVAEITRERNQLRAKLTEEKEEVALCWKQIAAMSAEVERLNLLVKATALTYDKALTDSQARLTALESQEPVAWAMKRSDGLLLDIITLEEHARIEGDYTIPLFLAAGAAPKEQT